jgi:hypothetical protein
MAFFSIENVLSHKIVKNIVNMNYNVIMNDIVQIERKREENISLSLKHPRVCQPKIPIKDKLSLIKPNLKTMDDIFDIQTSIISILSHSDNIEYNTIHSYYKWDCENFSEKYGYTHFYVVVSIIDEEDNIPYYAIEVQRITGTNPIIRYILHELTDRLNILSR